MELSQSIAKMKRCAAAIEALLSDVDTATAVKRPQPQKWCLAEIAAHLHEEEMFDFRVRVDYTLHKPGESWPGINPEAWVTERNYRDRPLEQSLLGFQEERAKSLAWLAELQSPNWDAAYEHPHIGVLRAGDIMASWEAHDLLHGRQILWTLFQILDQTAEPYKTRYAGLWPQNESLP